MGPFEPQQALRPRGVFRIAGSSLAALLRSIPSLIGLSLIFGIVTTIALVAIAIPVLMGSNIDQNVGLNEVGIAIALLMSAVALPFFVIWGSGTKAALLSLLGARSIGVRQRAGQAYSVGLKRALPLLGTDILFALATSIVMLPVLFLWLASAFFFGLSQGSAQPAFIFIAVPLAAIAAILGLFALHVLLRMLFARFVTVFENQGPVASLERAWALSHRHGLRIFGYLVGGLALFAGVLVLAGWGLSGAVETVRGPLETMDLALQGLTIDQGPAAFFSDLARALPGFALLIIPGFAMTMLGVWFQIALMMLYFDLRHRDEGFGRNGGLDPSFEMEVAPRVVPSQPVPDDHEEAMGSAPAPGESDHTLVEPERTADSTPPAPWELASLAAAGIDAADAEGPRDNSTEQPSDAGSADLESGNAGAVDAERVPRSGSTIEAVIPGGADQGAASPKRSEEERSLADAIAHAADGGASPSESQARWRIVDRLLRWLPEAEEDDDAPLR